MRVDTYGGSDQGTYNGIIDLSMKNNSHTKAFEFIADACGGRAGRILEVGCASGYFGAVLRQHGHEVWGIEVSPQATSVARRQLDYVYEGTIEEFLASDDARHGAFDYIVFGDVLEHLVDPIRVLRTCMSLLHPTGKIVASIPNVAHLAVRLMLLEGRWEYSQLGLLDSTHLRFFTRSSILELFSKAELAVTHMDAVRLPVDMVEIKVNPALLSSITPLLADNEQDVFQYVLMAERARDTSTLHHNARFLAENGPRILCLLPIIDWSLGNIRINHPLEKWQQLYGGMVRVDHAYTFKQENFLWADTVILQREADLYILELIKKAQAYGKRVIFDIDDLLIDVPSFLSVHTHSMQVKPYLEQALRMVDAITVPTVRLQEKMAVYNAHVYVTLNAASTHNMPAKHYHTDLITLIVASSDTVRMDFVVPFLRRLMSNGEVKIRLIGIGPPAKYLADAGLVVECYERLPYEQFKAFLASIDNAIGVIPLDDSVFSSCKSAIKFVDYSLAGIPTVCSAVAPYTDVVENGVTGLLVPNDEQAWYTTIQQLALAAIERQKLAAAARVYCYHHFSLVKAAEGWQEVLATVKAGQSEPITGALKRQLRWRKLRTLISRHSRRPAAYRRALRLLLREGPRGLRARLARE